MRLWHASSKALVTRKRSVLVCPLAQRVNHWWGPLQSQPSERPPEQGARRLALGPAASTSPGILVETQIQARPGVLDHNLWGTGPCILTLRTSSRISHVSFEQIRTM